MLAADRRALKANVQTSYLAIREREVNLFADNLNAVGTQAALVAGFAFSGMLLDLPDNTPDGLQFCYYLCVATSMSSSLFCVCHATFLNIFGPSLALQGVTPEAMLAAIDGMKRGRFLIYFTGMVSIMTFGLAAILGTFILQQSFVGATVAVPMVLGLCAVIYIYMHTKAEFDAVRVASTQEEGSVALHETFHGSSANGGSGDGPGGEESTGSSLLSPVTTIGKRFSTGSSAGGAGGAKTDTSLPSAAAAASAAASAAAGGAGELGAAVPPDVPALYTCEVWSRDENEELFDHRFLVIEDGILDFFGSKSDYLRHESAVNTNPVVLGEYYLELDRNKLKSRAIKISKVHAKLRRAVTGDEELSVRGQLFAKKHNRNRETELRFALVPRPRKTEIRQLPPVYECYMASMDHYTECLSVLRRCVGPAPAGDNASAGGSLAVVREGTI